MERKRKRRTNGLPAIQVASNISSSAFRNNIPSIRPGCGCWGLLVCRSRPRLNLDLLPRCTATVAKTKKKVRQHTNKVRDEEDGEVTSTKQTEKKSESFSLTCDTANFCSLGY